MVEVKQLSVLAKPSPSEDFRLAGSAGDRPPELVVKAAHEWLQTHLDSRDDQLVILAELAGSQWLFRAAHDQGTDRAGRPLSFVAFGSLPGGLGPEQLTRALFGAYIERCPARDSKEPCNLKLADQPMPSPELAWPAILTLALGAAERAGVDNGATAAMVMEQIGTRHIDFIALIRRSLPGRWPRGAGLVVSEVAWDAPAMVKRFPIERVARAGLNMAGLAGLPLTPGAKAALLRLALGLGGPEEVVGLDLGPQAMDWLLGAQCGRVPALQRADSAQVSEWLSLGMLTAQDLPYVQGLLSGEHSRLVAGLLKGSPDSLQRFIAMFGPEADGLELVLPDDALGLLSRIKDPAGDLSRTPMDQKVLALLAQAGILAGLGLEEKARLMAAGHRSGVEALWRVEMLATGMNQRLYEHLFNSGPPSGMPPSGNPAPAPDKAWLTAVEPKVLWQAGSWASASQAWRKWWEEALAAHPLLGPGHLPGLESEWSETLGHWVCGCLQDGELELGVVLDALARWRAQPQPPSGTWAELILRESGVTDSGGVIALFKGLTPLASPDGSSLVNLGMLLERGLVSEETVIQAVADGADASWLKALGAGPASVSLLSPACLPPAAPPAEWPEKLDGLLAAACGRQWFWTRFQGRLSPEMLGWLENRTVSREGGVRLKALQDCFNSGGQMELDVLRTTVGALPGSLLCAQVAAWAFDHGEQRQAALELLLGAPGLGSQLRLWLKTELLTSLPSPTAPAMTSREMLILLPLLHPVRDVLRQVLHSPARMENEAELAEALVRAISAMGGPPTPAPGPEAAAFHRDLVLRLGDIPGWEHWKHLETAPGGAPKSFGEDQS